MTSAPHFHFPEDLLSTGSSQNTYYEYIHTPTLSSGIYTLHAGEKDFQKPHTEDELYYVLSGKSSMYVGDQKFIVRQGDVIFVPANVDHRFYDIVEDLKLLVFFSRAQIQ